MSEWLKKTNENYRVALPTLEWPVHAPILRAPDIVP